MTKSQLARKYRDQYGWEMPTLKLARIMYDNNKLLFTDIEDARGRLRYIEGKMGKNHRKFSTIIKLDERDRNPFKLPESDEQHYEPYVFSGHKKIGILSDIHLPYHNIDALTEAIKQLKIQKIDGLLLNGDTLDCHHLSRFIKDPKKRDFKGELDALNQFFDVIEKQLGCRIYFKIGNHENRYEHFLMMKAHELKGIEAFEFENIIKAKERGVVMIKSGQYMKIGSLNGIHGHEYPSVFSPVNVARGLYMKSKVSSFQGHNHSTSEHTETDMNGKITTTWSVGCLCELSSSYAPLTKWNHGFACVELDGDDFQFNNKRIYKGKTI
jgi:predicted phosphodiesterase